ncbi:hypothetical protein [Ramlibacter albus]|uniref:DUF4365 domain-containing protein n=1 Tax=Ramlibacter albus TaxID=2079448 RepID=A0A923MCQ5_9BURK|nr:hypothetical protein [Ramlibacter albus]MBC5767575.1 hypothetical protein [Ramlibacter albus]
MPAGERGKYALTSTQIGVIGENVVANALLLASGGRLSPFYSIADDDGIDLLVYDKETGVAIPVQVKTRTKTLNKSGTTTPGSGVHFEVREAALREFDYAHLVAVLLHEDMTEIRRSWLIPMPVLRGVARVAKDKFVIRPNAERSSLDKFTPFRCNSPANLSERLIKTAEQLAAISSKKKSSA